MPDEKDKPEPMGVPLPFPLVKIEDAIPDDPMSDEIERLEREAKPIEKRCPHCGGRLPREE